MSSTTEDMYRSYTESAGKYCRQLAIICAALIWLFHTKTVDTNNPILVELNCILKVSFAFTLLSLFFDLVQEARCSYLWRNEFKADGEKLAKDCDKPINAANFFIVCKISSMAISYIFLAAFIFSSPLF